MRIVHSLVCVCLSFAAPAFAAVTVTSPKSGSTDMSPVSYVAAAATTTCSKGVGSMGIYVNNKLTYVVNGAKMNTTLSLAPGAYSTVVEEWDHCGGASYTKIPITVSSSGGGGGGGKPGVTVTSPAANSTVVSPVSYVATATAASSCAKGVASMGIYVNNKLVYVVNAASLNKSLSLANGAEHTVVEEWDKCGGAAYTTINLTVGSSAPKQLTAIAVTPSDPSVAVGSTEQFTAIATYSDNSTANVTSTATWAVANTGVAAITSGGLATGETAGSTQVTASLSGVTGSDPFNVTAAASGGGVNVVTWHFDNGRSGLNNKETSLSPSNVSAKTFGKLFSYLVDGYAYAEPLLMSNVTIKGAVHNVVYVATERDSVYAFDADSYGNGTPLWQVSLLKSGETPLTGATVLPNQGITSTPVIDPASNTIYAVSMQKSAANGTTFRLNALDITTGAQKFGGPVTIHASVPGTNSSSVNGVVSLPTSCIQRAALLLANGNVYMGFGSCHSGWLLAYDAHSLAQTAVFNASPNLDGEGQFASAGGIWMGSGGPVADGAGNIYVSTGNGPWDGKTAYADSILKFSPTLKLEDYFTPNDYQYLNCHDGDLASGGLLLIPGSSNVVGGGKGGKLYLVNTGNLGQEQVNDAGAVQTIFFESDLSSPYSSTCTDASGDHTTQSNSYEIFGTAAYYNGSIYLGVTPTTATAPAGIREFVYSGKLTYGAETKPSILQGTRGTTPFISSDGSANGVLWMIDTGQPLQTSSTPTSSTLRAYDANDLGTELYNSSDNSADVPGFGIKFSSPVVANGKVYISTGHDLTTVTNPRGELDVYGLK